MYLVSFSKQASKDKTLLKKAGLEQKTKDLLNLLLVNPFQKPPPYEKLLGNLGGYYSRRINLQHRLVYRVDDNTNKLKDAEGNVYEGIVCVKRMWTHYE
ncbi:MAG: Txe/YoeB family addiction module toxin [Oscillospiraceae bacterium]|nr:Txe/YoeB family addiction module toxin [Oscillospiraceae bacterium]